MQMQELNKIACAMEIMGSSFIEISKQMKTIKMRVCGTDKMMKKKPERPHGLQLLRQVSSQKRSKYDGSHNEFVIVNALDIIKLWQCAYGLYLQEIMSTLGSKWKKRNEWGQNGVE